MDMRNLFEHRAIEGEPYIYTRLGDRYTDPQRQVKTEIKNATSLHHKSKDKESVLALCQPVVARATRLIISLDLTLQHDSGLFLFHIFYLMLAGDNVGWGVRSKDERAQR